MNKTNFNVAAEALKVTKGQQKRMTSHCGTDMGVAQKYKSMTFMFLNLLG